jgi:MFS family permease
MISNGLINTGALGQFPPALEELHGVTVAAIIISLYSVVGVLGKLILGWVNDKFGIIKGILFGCITFGLPF